VTSLSRPGGNVTGNASQSAELIAKRLELIKEALPKTVRVAILSNPDNPDTPPALRALDQAGRNLGVVLDRFDFRSIDDFASAFAQAAQAGVSAVLLVDDNFVYAGRAEIAWHALKSRLPTMVGQPEGAAAGCLFAYGPNRAALFRSAAGYVDKILKGAKPADLPIQQPTKFELVINLKTAKALGLEMPPTLLARADEVIE
jgi:putative ABC transport system substrate-binding protein